MIKNVQLNFRNVQKKERTLPVGRQCEVYSYCLQSHPSPFNSVCLRHPNHSKIPLSASPAFS